MITTRSSTFWLLLGLFALAIVACTPAAANEVAQIEEVPRDEALPTDANMPEPDNGDPGQEESNDTTQKGAKAGSHEVTEAPEEDEDARGGSVEEAASEPVPVEAPNEVSILTIDDRTERQRLFSEEWATDWNKHTVPYSELLALLPKRDGIPAIDDPQLITTEEASAWLASNEPVIAFEWAGDARAYPLQIMTYHEIVNDVVGDMPVTVSFCPLCNSAVVFDRTLDGTVYDFGTSGWLRHSDLVMYDRQTESLWQQFTGEGIVGKLAGRQLTLLPSSIVSFTDFEEVYPEGKVLSRDTGHQRPYGQNPYPGYDAIGQNPFAFVGVPDGRLAAMERVITVSLDNLDVAYPLSLLIDQGVINDHQAGQEMVIFHVGGTSSALDAPIISFGADVGATGVFDPNLESQKLTFVRENGIIKDEQTGSSWNILGHATEGPLAGQTLNPIVHGDHFWFAWAAFRPETMIFGS